MDIKKLFESKSFIVLTWAVLAVIVLLLIFNVGLYVGFKKASFSYGWGENYHKNFGGPRNGFMREFEGQDFIEGNGTVGQILKKEADSLIIKGRDDAEKVITTDGSTTFRRFRDSIRIDDLNVGDLIVVIGEPTNDGKIAAKLIRVIPAPGVENHPGSSGQKNFPLPPRMAPVSSGSPSTSQVIK